MKKAGLKRKTDLRAPALGSGTFSRHATWLFCAGLLAAVALVYGQVAHFGFFPDDDPSYVIDNPHVNGGLSWSGIGWALTSDWAGNWQPLTWISYQLDCQFWGLNAGALHVTNLFFHLANSILLFFVLKQMTGAPGRSAVVAGLFALHPVQVESVAWIAERKNMVSGFFWMLALLAYVRYAQKPVLRRYLVLAALVILDFLSKATSMTLPFVLLLLDFWPLQRTPWNQSKASRPWKSLILEKLPLMAVALLPLGCGFWAQNKNQDVASLEFLPLELRVENCLVSYAHYLAFFFYPLHQIYIYPYAVWKPVTVLGATLILMVITALILSRVKTEPYLLVGWFWYLGVLFPTNGLVQLGRFALNDHYLYLPLIGLALIAVWGGYDLLKKTPPWLTPLLAAAALLICAGLTARQASFWRSGVSLCRQVMALLHPSIWADHYVEWAFYVQEDGKLALAKGTPGTPKGNALDLITAELGNAYLLEGNSPAEAAQAADAFEALIRRQPTYGVAHANLAIAYSALGRTDEAMAQNEIAISLNPKLEIAYYNLGNLYAREKRPDLAVENYRISEKLRPDKVATHNNLGSALLQLGRLDEAEKETRLALDLSPTLAEARINLGNILMRENRFAEALEVYNSLVKDQPNDPEIHFDRARALVQLGRFQEAEAEYGIALNLNPDSPETYNSFGNLLGRENKPDEAVRQFEQALRLRPDFAVAHYNLALALKSMGRHAEATHEFEQAKRLDPRFGP